MSCLLRCGAVLVGTLFLAGCTHAGPTSSPSTTGGSGATTASSSPSTESTPVDTATVTTPAPSASSDSPTPTPTSSPTVSAGVQRCATAALTVSLNGVDAAAGTRHRSLILTNTGASACTLFGYPGVSFQDAAHTQLSAAGDRDHAAPAPRLVTLDPGGRAHAGLVYHSGGLFTCTHVRVAALLVFPPDSTASLLVPFPEDGCRQASVHLLTVGPVVAGAGPAVG